MPLTFRDRVGSPFETFEHEAVKITELLVVLSAKRFTRLSDFRVIATCGALVFIFLIACETDADRIREANRAARGHQEQARTSGITPKSNPGLEATVTARVQATVESVNIITPIPETDILRWTPLVGQ